MLVLASQSPRRAELLNQLQVPFTTLALDLDESMIGVEEPADFVTRLARLKAATGLERDGGDNPVLGSDTIVVVGNTVLAKPENKEDCLRMLRMLSGKTHQVMTAVAVAQKERIRSVLVATEVTFKRLSNAEMDWYWDTGEPCDKAGSYGIQGLGGQFVKQIKGSYSAVVGLPLYETSQLLQDIGIVRYEC